MLIGSQSIQIAEVHQIRFSKLLFEDLSGWFDLLWLRLFFPKFFYSSLGRRKYDYKFLKVTSDIAFLPVPIEINKETPKVYIFISHDIQKIYGNKKVIN